MIGRCCVPKPRILILFLGIMALVMLLVSVALYRRVGGDFLLRYNEITSVMDGVDPYLVWTGEVEDPRFFPYNHPELQVRPEQSQIHAYTPWSYAYMMPLIGKLSLSRAWTVIQVLQLVALILIAAFAFCRCSAVKASVSDGIVGIASAFALWMTYGVAFIYGNYGILIAALFLLMVFLLNRGHDVLAGVCWALAMTKPQCAALIVIPLVIQRKWRTILTAMLICGLASLIPAILCGRNPIDMILQVRNLGAGAYVGGTALFPNVLVGIVFGPGHIGERELLLPINALLGISLAAFVCWMVRKSKDWLVLLSPAILFSTTWTYFNYIDRCVFSLPAIALADWCIREKSRRADCIALAGVCILSICGVLPLITCDGILQSVFSMFGATYPKDIVHSWCWWFDAFAMYVLLFFSFMAARHVARQTSQTPVSTSVNVEPIA